MLDQLGFADALAGADLVVTGEGSLDEQTLHGKAPAAVAAAATPPACRSWPCAGRCLLDAPRLQARRVRRRLHAARRGRRRRSRRSTTPGRCCDGSARALGAIGCPMS